jgi:hypothetical protein
MYGVVAKTSLSSSYYGAVGERGSSGIGSDYLPPATNPGHRDQSSPCPSSHSSGSISPYSPQVIKELINQVIQSGHTRELGLNFAHKLLTSTPGGIPVTNVSSQSASLYAQPPPDERMYCGQKLSSLDAMSDDQPQNLCVNESANLAADMSSKFKWPTASADDSTSGIDCGENGCCREPLDMSVTGPRTRPETPSDIESSIGTNSSPSLRVDDTRPGAENADSCSPGGVERMEIDPVEVGVTNELSGDEKPFPFDFGLIVPLPDLTRVPELKFWDVGLPDLGSEEDVFRSPMPPDTAARREETESVLAWLTEATEVFTTCINMCRMYSEEEEKGIRPVG